MRPVALQHHRLLGPIDDRIDAARCVGLKPHRVDALLGTLSAGQLVQPLDDALFVEIDGRRAAGLRHAQSLGHVIDGDDLPGAEKNRAADRHLADRAAAPDGDGVGRLDVALDGGLPAGGKDVAEEQDLLVGEAWTAP